MRGRYGSYVLVCCSPSGCFCLLPQLPLSGEGQGMDGRVNQGVGAGQGTEEPGTKKGT